jgi:Sigma-70 region 2
VVTELTEAEVGAASEREDFGQFVAAEGTRLVRACLLLTGNVADAEDLAQEALSRVLERWSDVSLMESPAGYLYRTAMNLDRKRLRRLSVAARRFVDHEQHDDLSVAEDRLDILREVAALPATGETFRLDTSKFVHGSSISMDSRDLPAGTTESGCSSDTISTREALAATAVVAATLGTAWVLSKPPELRPAPAPRTG